MRFNLTTLSCYPDEDTDLYYTHHSTLSYMLPELYFFYFSVKKLKRDAKSKKAKPDHLEDIPFRLREIMKSKERMKTGSLKPKKPKQGEKSFFRLFACIFVLFCL